MPGTWDEHGIFFEWRAKYGGMDASMISQMKSLEDENCRLKKMYAEMSMQAELLKEALEKNDPAISTPGDGRESSGVARVSFALACRTFEVRETCYRYSAKLNEENEQIADLLIGLTRAKKAWGFGLCFL